MNLQYIVALIPLLNSSTNSLFLYLLPLATLLNSCMNFFIVFPPYSSLFNSTTFTDFSSFSNSFLIFARNSSIFSCSNNPLFKSSSMFFFQTSTNPSCIYDSTYYICSSTGISLILICTYSLYAVINPATFPELPSNSCGLATLTCILGHVNTATPLFLPTLLVQLLLAVLLVAPTVVGSPVPS